MVRLHDLCRWRVGALGRGGSYAIRAHESGTEEPAIGFSLYPDDLIDLLARQETPRDTLFLPLGHDAHPRAAIADDRLAHRRRVVRSLRARALAHPCRRKARR
ncbi:hypothetical protein [Novosphingobium sp.]|uniref:hypothetical protein n=1 Tax=Novosphingobium sp. TaxID=1874826 RepID=UPI00342D56FC